MDLDKFESLLKENNDIRIGLELSRINDNPLTTVGSAVVFGEVVDPLLAIFGKIRSNSRSKPAWD